MFVISTFNSLKLPSIYSDDRLIYSQVALFFHCTNFTFPKSCCEAVTLEHRGMGGFFSE